ncbi:MAG: aromatic ring-hydroxylating dioxygenase subunit alpha [Anaerolineae bacterium]|nr:aromatic ring-hydroxylating dioxygenase subunit alpha [Anaerolineae bacterium]
MIPNQWYVVLESNQVRDKPVGVTRMGEKLVFWRDGEGTLSCLRDRCVHRGVALSKGRVVSSGRLQCPFHGFEYDVSGRVRVIPANGQRAPVPERFRVHGYPTHEAHGWIWIWWGDAPPAELAPPRFFDDLDDTFLHATVRDPWDAHYSRVIENQLDVVHLPFVHADTIGRGCRTLVEGPGVLWRGDDMFDVYVYNKVDDGSTPRKPDEVPVPRTDVDFKLEFLFPNLWENHISADVRIVGAFVPVDDAHTILYLRFYQRFLTLPLLGQLVTRLAAPANLRIAHQDRRVVTTQVPKRSGLVSGEVLIQGDRPIVEYRRRRQALIEAAGARPGSQT